MDMTINKDAREVSLGPVLRYRRMGRIAYQREFSETEWFAEAINKIPLVPLHCNLDPITQRFVLYAFSPLFEKVAVGSIVPTYEIILNSHRGGWPKFVKLVRIETDESDKNQMIVKS